MKHCVRISLYIQPRSSKNEIVGEHGGAIKVRLTAAPVDGEANAELQKFLSKKLGISKSQIEIVSGGQARRKIVEITGEMSEAETLTVLMQNS